ncbi:hypothetical protein CTA1_69, partial [Colletotrichum tanaceti]
SRSHVVERARSTHACIKAKKALSFLTAVVGPRSSEQQPTTTTTPSSSLLLPILLVFSVDSAVWPLTMRAFAHLPMLGGLLVAAASSQQTSDLSRRNEKLHRFYENEAKTGSCLIYVNKSVTNDGKTPCRIFCKNSGQPETTVGCHSEHVYNPNQKYPWDTDGNEYLPGKCLCADKIDPVTEAIATPVIESLANLDKVICGVFVQSVVESISIGFAFVPGGQGVTVARAATRAAVEGAKSFAENGMNPGDFFDGWVKKSCGLDKLQLDYADTFASLVNAPDSAGTSTGCKRKKKSDCKKLDAKPDPKTTKKDDGPKTTTTKKEDGPTTTTTKTEAGPTTTTTTTTSTSTSTSASASASASSSGTPVTCESCRSPGAKKAARDARWGSMFVPRAAGGDTCLLDNSKGGDSCEAGGGDLAARDGLLSERALTRADPMLNVNGRDFWIDCGQHKPCGQAKGDSNIDKYYYLEGDAKCGGDLKHGTFRDVGNSVFQNDHVYEKQTLALFLQWLGDGSTTPIGASTKPRPAWVAEVLLDEDSPRNFKLQPSNRPLGIPQGGAPLDDVLAYGIARSDPLSRRRGGTAGMPIERAAKNFALVE